MATETDNQTATEAIDLPAATETTEALPPAAVVGEARATPAVFLSAGDGAALTALRTYLGACQALGCSDEWHESVRALIGEFESHARDHGTRRPDLIMDGDQ